MRVSLFVVAVAEKDDDAEWEGMPEELAVALRTFSDDYYQMKEFAVAPIFSRDEPYENVDDPNDEEAATSWQENALRFCVNIIADYQKGVIR
tara:strand:+ start:3283 stop:3558 length:276 start_codon:yes stop_codon:yes gene_type:complete